MNCVTHGCKNKSSEGKGYEFSLLGGEMWICLPCYVALTTPPNNNHRYSQLYRNMKESIVEYKVKVSFFNSDGKLYTVSFDTTEHKPNRAIWDEIEKKYATFDGYFLIEVPEKENCPSRLIINKE